MNAPNPFARDRREWLRNAAAGLVSLGAAGFAGGGAVRAATPRERRLVETSSPRSAAGLKELVSRAGRRPVPLTPSSALGPYYLVNMPVRSDIRENQTAGLPTRLYVRVIDAATEAPIPGASIDVWHANACGIYSGFAAQGTSGQTWLRGVQYADASGWCLFTSVFPGWYAGRTAHIHARVRRNPAAATVLTTQFFFGNLLDIPAIVVNPAVYQYVPPYSSCGAPQTVNATDPLYDPALTLTAILAQDGNLGLWAGIVVAI